MSSVGSSTATRRVWRAAPAPGAFGAVAITARLLGVIRQSPFRQHGSGGAGQMPRAVGNGLILPKVGSRRRRGLRFRELSLTADAGAWAKAPLAPDGDWRSARSGGSKPLGETRGICEPRGGASRRTTGTAAGNGPLGDKG